MRYFAYIDRTEIARSDNLEELRLLRDSCPDIVIFDTWDV